MPKNITQTLYGANMDITLYPVLSKEKLAERITQEVKDTQLFASRHFPDKIFMSKPQFKLLEHDMDRIEETNDRLYRVPGVGTVMEVYVVL